MKPDFFSPTHPHPLSIFYSFGIPMRKKGKGSIFFSFGPPKQVFFPFGVEEAWCNLVLKIIFEMCKKSFFFSFKSTRFHYKLYVPVLWIASFLSQAEKKNSTFSGAINV